MPGFKPSRGHQSGDDDYEEVYSQTDTQSNFSQAETVTGDQPQGAGSDRRSRLMLGFYSPTPLADVINLVNNLTSNPTVSNELCGFATSTAQRFCDASRNFDALQRSASQDELRRAKRSLLDLYETELHTLAQAIDDESPTGRHAIQPTSALIRTLTTRLPPALSTTISAGISGLLKRNGRLLESHREGGSSRSGRSSRGSGHREHFRSYPAFRQPSGSFDFGPESFMDDEFMFGGPMPGGGMPFGGMPESMFGGTMFDEPMFGGGMPGGGMPGGGMPGGGMPGGRMPCGGMPGGRMPCGRMPGDSMPGGSMPYLGGGGYGMPPFGSGSGGFGRMPRGYDPRDYP